MGRPRYRARKASHRTKMPRSSSQGGRKSNHRSEGADRPLRIIGGVLRGSKLAYSGDPRTRPMKDRVREAMFNLLGPAVKGTHAVDLFAGTGALALESISRGGLQATAIERHFPTAWQIEQMAKSLGIADQVHVIAADTFWWARQDLDARGLAVHSAAPPWSVFCCPPYAFYHQRIAEIQELLAKLIAEAPPGSRLLVESDADFDPRLLPEPDGWDVRSYSPAVLSLFQVGQK